MRERLEQVFQKRSKEIYNHQETDEKNDQFWHFCLRLLTLRFAFGNNFHHLYIFGHVFLRRFVRSVGADTKNESFK